MFKYELGQEVKDVVTSYVGTVVTRMDHITGCATYLVQRKYGPKEEVKHAEHFDEPRLEATGKSVDIVKKKGNPGGPHDVPRHK